MLDVFQFIFSSFWIWLGAFLMLACVSAIIGNLLAVPLRILAARRK